MIDYILRTPKLSAKNKEYQDVFIFEQIKMGYSYCVVDVRHCVVGVAQLAESKQRSL